MAYEQNNWQVGDAITLAKMQHIETGIAAAHNVAETANTTAINTASTINDQNSRIAANESAITSIRTTISTIGQGSNEGSKAWAQIFNAIEMNGDTVVTSLNDRFIELRNSINNINTELSGARGNSDNLGDEMDSIKRQISNINGSVSTINSKFAEASFSPLHGEQQTVANRLDQIETRAATTTAEITTAYESTAFNRTGDYKFTSLDSRLEEGESRINQLRSDINTALESTAYNKTGNNKYETIDARFEAVESEVVGARGGQTTLDARLDNIEQNASSISSDKISISAIANNLTTSTEGKVLDARQGKELEDKKVNYTDVKDNLTSTDADKPLSANQGKVLKTEIDNINTAIGTDNTTNSIKGRITILENEITGATDGNNLNTRFEAVEDRLDAIDDGTNITISGINTKIDTIAGELGMFSESDTTNGTRIDTLASNLGTAEGNITTLQNTINDNTTGLAATKAIADAAATTANAAATASDLTALAGRVTTLEQNPQSATTIIENVTYNNDGIPTNISNPSSDIDYLLKKDDNYYYWKYINNNWKLISGGGQDGSSASSAEFYTTLPQTGEDNIDYFIGSGINYTHYRYRNNEWVQILPAHLINSVSVDTSVVGDGENAPTKSRPIIKELGSDTNLLANFNAIKSISSVTTEAGTTLSWTNIDGEVQEVTITGGGGGSSSSINAFIDRVTGKTTNGTLTAISGEECIINYIYSATERVGNQEELIATTGTGVWSINGVRVATQNVTINNPANENDYNTFDISQYLQTGINNITLKVSIIVNDETINRTKTWSVDVKNFSLIWDYDESTVNEGAVINFSCIPYGIDITKTLHLKVGTQTQTQTVTTSGIPTTVTLTNNFTHGVYTAEMWMTATINEEPKETPHIFHDFIVVQSGNNSPIIAATLPSTTMDQYDTLSIPFVVYNPVSTTSTVILAVDGTTIDTRENIGRTTQTWYYTPTTAGAKVLTITVGSVTKTLNLTVNSVNINNEEIGDYAFKLKASEIPSNNALQNWYYDNQNPTTTKLQFSNNFDWINGGIQTELDENEQIRSFIRVKSGTTMTLPYKMFAVDPRDNGANFKIVFKIENCRDYDATTATNVSNDIGITLNAHKASFKSTTTVISTQYGEDEYTELEFEVYKSLLSNGNPAPDQYMIAWVDGVMTTARQYGGNFVQASPADLVIGSNDCDICIYLIKYYAKALSRDEHIINFIADAPNATEMVRRYNRNDILDADGDISYEKLANKNRDCRVWLYDIERMTKAKDDLINVNQFQQIWENGDQYYQLQGTNAKLKIQGTSSFNYRYGAANTDIDFGKKKAPDATLVDGYGNNLLADDLEYKGFKINDNSLPITYSNTKVNFASCEQVNNMCNAEWYQRYQPFPSLSERDCMEFAMGVQFIKDRHQNEPEDGIVLFTEKGANFNPEKYYMYSIANMGTSKKNTHIFHSEDECCIEIKENTTDAQKMKSFDADWVLPDHAGNYEIRYPDIKPAEFSQELKDGWERFVTWMVNSNPGAATNAALAQPVTFEPYTFRGHNREVNNVAGRHFEQVLRGVTVSQYAGTYTNDTFEYRMAKMLSECEDYMAMDSVIYHFCFIERHTMVDNVAKNTFWSSLKENGGPSNQQGYWIWDLSKNYDNDTADGNNNNGLLVFDYGNEATDTREGTPVFNGSDAVWFVFASNLYEACRAMFVNREAIGAWSSTNYHNYLLGEQRKVPERVWNECYWYDYLRTYEQAAAGDTNVQSTWINFLDGGQKIHQRKHFETYEEIYDSSKYRGSFSHNQSITLRGEAIDYQTLGLPAQESRFIITMFNKCYLTIWIGTNYHTVKCQKGVPVEVSFYEDDDPSKGYMSLSNSVIDIDSGSMVQAIGDLSRIYPSSGQFGTAKRLRSLQIGSDTAGYYNPNMNTNSVLTFNNKMLEYLYVQNLPQATYNLDLKNCPELKYINAAGSGFTGFEFATGGLLNEAYINNPTSLVMRNLDYLTNANFHLTSPTTVTSLRLEGGKLFDNYTFINQLTNLGVLRLTNINWSLNNVTLLDRLIELMGINESGYTIPQSYLAGTVSLLGTVYEGKYNAYTEAWSPDLVIDVSHASQFIQQHLVTYKDENDNKIYETYINHGSPIIDPYSSNLLDNIPEKDPDIQFSYVFGELDNAASYIPFSGWRIYSDTQSMYQTYGENPSVPVNGDITLYTVFSTSRQRYTVRWLVRENQLVYETPSPQNYGGGYDLTIPTIKDVQNAGWNTYEFTSSGNTCSYRIMTGWEKLPTNIAPTVVGGTYDIYATWLERTNVNYNTVLTSDEYSVAEKLLVLKEMANARSTLSIRDLYPIKLGYDGLKPGIDLLNAPKRYTGTVDVLNYTPFAVNKSFTLAIDYRFEHKVMTADEAVIVSCYSNANSSIQGFKLFYNPKSSNANPVPQVSFGDTASTSTQTRTIGKTINTRNMVVLRHRAGDPLLYIYCGADNTGLASTYSSSNFRKTINWSAIASDAQLVLGGTNINDSSIANATGTIYSAKYWEEDLGEGECLQLANWCHETINFAIQDYDGYVSHNAINSTLTARVVLNALNASEMGTIIEPAIDRSTNSTVGWDPSNVRTFYNSRLQQALPILVQSVMNPVTVPHRKANLNFDQGGYIIASTGTSTTQDYVFAPTSIEAGDSGSSAENHSVEAVRAFPWYTAGQMTALQYNDGVFNPITSNANYTNIRFPYYLNNVNNDVKIYIGYPSLGGSFYAWANDHSITLNPGDILIPENSNVAYIYVSSTDVGKGAPLTTSTASYLSNTLGGWIESVGWWTRSVPSQNLSPSGNKFICVDALGTLTTGTTKEFGLAYSIAL